MERKFYIDDIQKSSMPQIFVLFYIFIKKPRFIYFQNIFTLIKQIFSVGRYILRKKKTISIYFVAKNIGKLLSTYPHLQCSTIKLNREAKVFSRKLAQKLCFWVIFDWRYIMVSFDNKLFSNYLFKIYLLYIVHTRWTRGPPPALPYYINCGTSCPANSRYWCGTF